MVKEKSAGAVIYRVPPHGKIQFLLLQSAHGKPWGFPKGKLDHGESSLDAARREIAEESGLTDIAFAADFRFEARYDYHRGAIRVKKEVIYFLAHTHEEVIRISNEHVASRWASYDEARSLVVFENSRELLHKVFDYLSPQFSSDVFVP